MRGENTKQEANRVQQDEFKTAHLPLDLPNSAMVRQRAIVSNDQLKCQSQVTSKLNKNNNLPAISINETIKHRNSTTNFTHNNMTATPNKLADICSDCTNIERKGSLIDELMSLEERRGRYMSFGFLEHESMRLRETDGKHTPLQEVNTGNFWREYSELSQALKGQHKFLMAKLEERKRDLLLVEAAWTQRDLRHAIERLLELYSQGLVFSSTQATENFRNRSNVRLGSLKSALVSDVIGILLLRPKLWSLDLCHLLLPVVVGDLLQQRVPGSEGHVEVALRAIRLTLVQLGPLITSTLESQKESSRLFGGVDLSREERINKCLACFKLLAEARRQLLQSRLPGGINGARLAALEKELEPLFKVLGVDSCVKLHCQQSGQQRRTRAKQSVG